MNLKVPCKDCVLIAICRNKLFDELINDCKLLLDALYFDKTTPGGNRSVHYGDKLNMVQDVLNPEHWEVIVDPKDKFAHVIAGDRCHASLNADLLGQTSKWPLEPDVIVPKNFQLKRKVKAKAQERLIKKIRERCRESS